MLSSLLGVIDLITYISRTHVILAIVFAIIGIVIACLATRIVTAINKGEKPAPGNTKVIVFKSIGLVLIVVALICAMIQF